MISDPRFFEGSGFIGADVATTLSDEELREGGDRFASEMLHRSEIPPDVWPTALIRNPEELRGEAGRGRGRQIFVIVNSMTSLT